MEILERAYKAITEITEGLEHLSHEWSLRVMKLLNLANRRLRKDLINTNI